MGKERTPERSFGVEKPGFTPIILKTSVQQEAVFSALRPHLIELTSAEIYGSLPPAGIQEVNTLRELYKSLAINLYYKGRILSQEWLLVGIGDFIPREELESLTDPEETQIGPESILADHAAFILAKIIEKEQKSLP